MNEIKINRESLAWAAGFFDGEGSVSFTGDRLNRYPLITIQQNDPEVLYRFRDAVAFLGVVHGPYSRRDGGNPFYNYQVSSFEKVQAVIAMLWPFLSVIKKSQAHNILSYIREQQEQKYSCHFPECVEMFRRHKGPGRPHRYCPAHRQKGHSE